MAKPLNQLEQDYIKGLSGADTQDSKKLYDIMYHLRETNAEAFVSCCHLIYAYKCPADVAWLAFDIVCKRIALGKNPNPQVIFSSLSNNDRAKYDKVKPFYDKAVSLLNNMASGNTPKQTATIASTKENNMGKNEDNNDDDEAEEEDEAENDEEYTPVLRQVVAFTPTKADSEFAENYLYEKYFKANDTDRFVVNTCVIPKSAWLIHVYAVSYEDYCSIVQTTVKELNDMGITVFLTKPEIFKASKASLSSPKIAYSILIGEKFNFSALSEAFVTALDSGEDIPIANGIKIAKRATIQFSSFVGPYFPDSDGTLTDSEKKFISSFKEDEDVLAAIETIGTSSNVVKHYIEIKTGIPQSQTVQIYKSILCRKEDIIHISSILRGIKGGQMDFMIESDKDDIRILFVHMSHLQQVVDAFGSHRIPFDLNPNFDETKM